MRQYLRRLGRDMARDWQMYLFALIPVVYIILFAYVPMFGIQIAFKRYTARAGIWGSKWVGLANFEKFLHSYQFERVLVNTLVLSAYSIVASFPMPIIFALLMNSLNNERFKRVSQTIVTMPHFISVVVLVGMIMQVFSNRTGIYGAIGLTLNGAYPPNLFADPMAFRQFYVWSGVWQGFGWGSIIYIAALSSVSPSLHEAAQIDGASRFQRVLHIDLPSILPTITIMFILRMGSVMSIGFEKVFLLQNSLNLSTSEVISTYVYKIGFEAGGVTDFSYSTAIGLFNSLINMALIVTVNFISRRMGETSLW